MAEHVEIVDSERHEPRGASTAVINNVLISNGDGTTSFRRVSHADLLNVPLLRQGVAVSDLADDADIAAVRTTVNALLASLRAAGLIGG